MSVAPGTIAPALRQPNRSFTGGDVGALIRAACDERVLVLLGSELRAAGALDRWPQPFRDAFLEAERGAAAIDCIRHRELAALLEALNAAAVRTLVFKGAALAYSHYPAPHVRARTDTDLLIPASHIASLERCVKSLGYAPQHETTGELVSYQSHYGKRDRHGVFHAVDVHWKISNRHALADRVAFEELWSDRQPLPSLGPGAATVSTVHALVLALVHRAGHHPGSLNLLWMWDLHLLVRRMSAIDLRLFARFMVSRGLGPLACEGLFLVRDWFATPGLDEPLQIMSDESGEHAAPLTAAGSAQAEILRQDLRALPTWRDRGRLVREHLFPSTEYIRGKYQARSAFALPALYAWRIVSGVPRWLRRHENG